MGGQRFTFARRAPRTRRRPSFLRCRLFLRVGDFAFFEAELQLVRVEPLGVPAELCPLELPDNVVHPLDAAQQFVTLGNQRQRRSPQLRQVFRKRVHRRHGRSGFDHIPGSTGRSFSASDSICRGTQRVAFGFAIRGTCTRDQSSPSTRAANCAGDRRITPSVIGGQRKEPCSSRFQISTKPLPSHTSSLIRSARRLRNTSTAPEKGSCTSVSLASAASESAPLRKSTGRVAISTRTPGGTGITAPPSPPAAPRASAANPRPARRGSQPRQSQSRQRQPSPSALLPPPPDRSPWQQPAQISTPLLPAAPTRRCGPAGARHRPAVAATHNAALPPTRWRQRQTTPRRSAPCPRATTPAARRRR